MKVQFNEVQYSTANSSTVQFKVNYKVLVQILQYLF